MTPKELFPNAMIKHRIRTLTKRYLELFDEEVAAAAKRPPGYSTDRPVPLRSDDD